MKFYFAVFIIFIGFSKEVFAESKTYKNVKTLPKQFQAEARKIEAQYTAYLKSQAAKSEGLRLDIEDKSIKAVYSKSGIDNSDECKENSIQNPKNPCIANGWLTNASEVRPTGQLEFVVAEDVDGNETLYSYTEVKYAYNRDGQTKSGEGWISHDFISFKPVVSSYAEIKVENKRAAILQAEKSTVKCETKPKASQSNLTDLAKVSNKISEDVDKLNVERKKVDEVAQALRGKVGQCALEKPKTAPRDFPSEVAYDQFALPKIKQVALPANIKNEKNEKITQKDLIDIDSLARTIFAEMASCVPVGTQYTLAVARVIKIEN